jgi:ATP-dependent 26S proteasome regulatory subunit
MVTYTLYSSETTGSYLLVSVYEFLKSQNQIEHAFYIGSEKVSNNDYSFKGKKNIANLLSPSDGTYNVNGIEIKIQNLIINNQVQIINIPETTYHVIKQIDLTHEDKTVIETFIQTSYTNRVEMLNKFQSKSTDKLTKKTFHKFGWIDSGHIPKRNIDTVFLKKDQVKELKEKLDEFLDVNTYNDYRKHGIPYKLNILLHGPPGVGKTTLIHSMASMCSANVCILNINEDLKESELLDSFISINETEGVCFVVIEDIDCIFEDRKTHDGYKNNITMQGLLNCMDGFNNQEGLILILTTNHPDKLDDAITRTGRIDLNIGLTNCDKYQIQEMYKSFFQDEETFEKIWHRIKNFNMPPSAILDFFFTNRKATKDGLLEKLEKFVSKLESKHNSLYN